MRLGPSWWLVSVGDYAGWFNQFYVYFGLPASDIWLNHPAHGEAGLVFTNGIQEFEKRFFNHSLSHFSRKLNNRAFE